MSEMIERLCRAHYQNGKDNGTYDMAPPYAKENARARMKHLLTTLREPTPEMISAADSVIANSPNPTPGDPWRGVDNDDIWRAMIDAALKE